jgi:uncharacterized protein (DUF2164 family)
MAVRLSEDDTKEAIASIRRYCSQHLDVEVGDLQAGGLLDYFLRELAPSVYNAAIADAQTYFNARLEDLEGTCHEREFGYWPKSSTVRRK